MTAPAASPWSPLRQATFRWLWLASIASNIGTWMHEVGAGWLMTSLSASPLNVALVQVAGSLPMFFLALPAGALADIVDKRRYLLGVQLWMALVATLLASLTLLQLTSVWLLLGLTLCMGIGTALMMPAWSATTPELVGKDELPAAVALSSVGVNLARAVGPAIAGVLVSLVGPWLTFALNALSFFAVIAVLLAWKREAVPSVLPAERLFGALRAGWRYSRSSRPLQSVLVRAVAFFLGASAGMSLLPLIVRGELHGNAMDFGLLLGSVGVGAVLGAAFLPRLRERLGSDRLVLLSSVLYALVLVALALLRNLYLLVPVMLLSGAAWIAVLSSLQVAAQTSVPAWVRARALAVYILVFFGSMAAGGALWGLVASHLSITFALLCASAALLLGLFASLRCRLPVTEAEDLAPSLHWPAPLVDEEVDQERGPVMVTLEYDIDPQDAAAFQAAMVEVRAMRRRNGAVSWGLVQDSGNRRLWLEFFIDESWLEHLRHHQRVTRGELRVEAAARRFQSAGVEGGAHPPLPARRGQALSLPGDGRRLPLADPPTAVILLADGATRTVAGSDAAHPRRRERNPQGSPRMSYDYEKTSLTLYRAVFKANYDGDVGRYLRPDKELAEAAEVAPLLHPTFDSPNTPGVPARAPDIVAGRDGLYAPDTGGTSVFDRAGVLRRADGDFVIPDGTDIPPDLKVKQDSYNKRLQATHYTIMPAKPMYREVLMGQLDNFVRNAIRRQWEKARGL
ncbi:enterobactin exporter EntS [Pseudomonas aeruginosa]|nr:enterobactin exporter EntS [Pseudomonas aeruginosa]